MMRTAMHVRPAIASDWRSMKDVFQTSGREAWKDFMSEESLSKLEPPERWHDAIYSRTSEVAAMVVEAEGRLVGFAVVCPSKDDDAERGTAELDAFYTLPRFWGAGGGRALMEHCLEHLKKARFDTVTLWTEERNERARKFYVLCNWRLDGERRERTVHGSAIAELRYRREI